MIKIVKNRQPSWDWTGKKTGGVKKEHTLSVIRYLTEGEYGQKKNIFELVYRACNGYFYGVLFAANGDIAVFQLDSMGFS